MLCKIRNDIIEYDRHRIEGLKYSWDFRNMGAISSIDEISGVKASTVNYINKQQSTGSNDYFGVEPLPGSSNYKIETGYDIYMSGEVSIEMYLYVTYHSPATHDIITILDTSNDDLDLKIMRFNMQKYRQIKILPIKHQPTAATQAIKNGVHICQMLNL